MKTFFYRFHLSLLVSEEKKEYLLTSFTCVLHIFSPNKIDFVTQGFYRSGKLGKSNRVRESMATYKRWGIHGKIWEFCE